MKRLQVEGKMKKYNEEIIFQKIPIKKNRFKKEQKHDYRSVRKSARNSKKYLQNRVFAV